MTDLAYDVLEAKFGQFLNAVFGSVQEMKARFRDRTPRLIAAWNNRPRFFIGRERERLIAQLAAAGASPPQIAQFRSELADMENAVAGRAFAEFLTPYLSQLRPARDESLDGAATVRANA